MKGLFLAFGLIAALFISNNVQASIYDTATYHAPKSDSVSYYSCNYKTPFYSEFSSCKKINEDRIRGLNPSINFDFVTCSLSGTIINCLGQYTGTRADGSTYVVNYDWPNSGTWIFQNSQNSLSCPPDNYPNYTFERDSNNDGKIDQCYDPRELDNASKCSDLFNSGSILTAGSNTAPLVCKTFEDGSRCAFSRVNQGSTPYYQPNLEKGCFGDAEQIPDYDKNTNEPQPQPEQCVPYAGGYACAADPKNYCSSEFECVDGCGYVNGQFVCFRDEQCTGASCEPAPVDCTTVPDAPVCKEQQTTPEPSFCEKNPTVESCQSGSNFCKKNPLAPSCQLGGDNGGGNGGGGGFDFTLDYDRLINGMKDAAKSLIDESPIPDNTEMDKSLDDENKAVKSDYDSFLEDGVFNEIKSTSQRAVFSTLENIFPSGSANCTFNMGEFNIEICSTAEKVRGLLYWVFAILTLIYLRHLFYSTISVNAGK
ncbi:hypothetical protein [Shewanella sp. Shew256]|uniref:hypothetical protein n=1 Tax=Shewanella sp. Shew256 TaxID=1969376 RepID=UPI000B4A3B81|nr:hypothetical protein [Shewanella sp. Shew256]